MEVFDLVQQASWRLRRTARTWRRRWDGDSVTERAFPLVFSPSVKTDTTLLPAATTPAVLPPAARFPWLITVGGLVIVVVVFAAWQRSGLSPDPALAPLTAVASPESAEQPNELTVSAREPGDASYEELVTGLSPSGTLLDGVETGFTDSSPGAAVVLKQVEPIYPAAARQARIQGLVVVTYSVDANGRPTNLNVTKSVPALDDAAVAALRQWEYTKPPPGSTQKYRFHAEFVLERR